MRQGWPMVTDAHQAFDQLVSAVNRQAGCQLRFAGTAELGETAGAALVEWPDGRPSVLTTATVSLDVMTATAEALSVAHANRCPVPRHELVVQLESGVVAVVQERLPGHHPTGVDEDLIDLLVTANDGFADLLVARPELVLPHIDLSGLGSADLQEPLKQYSDRSRRLLQHLQRVEQPAREPQREDLVHSDLTVSNMLVQDHQVSGVIDWNNGAFRGDRGFALVKLLFDLTWEAAAPNGGRHRVQAGGLTRLEQVLQETVDPGDLRSYWAHWTLQMLHWTIRAANTTVIDLHLDLGERGLY